MPSRSRLVLDLRDRGAEAREQPEDDQEEQDGQAAQPDQDVQHPLRRLAAGRWRRCPLTCSRLTCAQHTAGVKDH